MSETGRMGSYKMRKTFKELAEENTRIKEALQAEPEFAEICRIVTQVKSTQAEIMAKKDIIASLQAEISSLTRDEGILRDYIKANLLSIDSKSGFTKMPLPDGGVVYLSEIKDNFAILDDNAVPDLYSSMEVVKKIDRKSIRNDVKEGKLSTSNWLKLEPPYCTVVIK